MKLRTRLVQAGRAPQARSRGTVNLPVARASTVTFDSLAEMDAVQQRFDADEPVPTYGIAQHAAARRLRGADGRARGRAPRGRRFPTGLAAVAAALLAVREGGRPHPRHRQRLRPDAALLRAHARALRRRDDLLRSAGRRRHRRADAAEHARGLPREPGLAHVRGAGLSRHRARGARARRRGDPRQHLGHGRLLPLLRPRRRPRGAGGDEVSGGPLRPADRRRGGERGVVAAAARHRRATSGRRRAPTTSSSRCAACARWKCACAQHEASGARRSRSGSQRHPAVRARPASRRSRSDPGHALWKRDFLGAQRPLRRRARAVRSRAQLARFIDGLECFALGYSWGGYESLVVPRTSERAQRAPLDGRAADPPARSASRIPPTSSTTSCAASTA